MTTITKESDTVIVRPTGGITATTVDKFRDELKELVDSGETNLTIDLGNVDMIDVPEFRGELEKYAAEANLLVVVEFSGLEFIGGAGLDAIVSAYDLGKKHNTRIVMAGKNALVRRILELTRLDMIIPIFADVAGALS